METVRDFIFLGSKITADGDCITLPTKVCLVKAMVFGIGEDSWESLGQQGDQTSQS